MDICASTVAPVPGHHCRTMPDRTHVPRAPVRSALADVWQGRAPVGCCGGVSDEYHEHQGGGPGFSQWWLLLEN